MASLHIEVSDNIQYWTQKASSVDRRAKEEKIYQIVNAICALLNSGGGKLEIYCVQNIKEWIRLIEQKIIEMIGIATMSKLIEIKKFQHEILINVEQSCKLITVNYNLFLPSQSQINVVPPNTSSDEVEKIIGSRITESSPVVIQPEYISFSKGQYCCLKEGADVELKQLKDSPSKCVTLADRVVGKSNKFVEYVSAFANHQGGHIYYGISGDGRVEGQFVNDKERHDITKKVNKAIMKMIWPIDEPKKGEHWDISFEPVHDRDSSIPSTFVIVISIASCPGGVFTESPESYYINRGEVFRMNFAQWHRRTTTKSVPKSVQRLQWSSRKNREIFHRLTPLLVQHRNDKDMEAFERLARLAEEKFAGANVQLIVLTEKITVAWKRLLLQRAKALLQKYKNILTSSPDSSIFEVRMLYLKSRIGRIEGKYEESSKTTEEGLQRMEVIPVELHTTFYYMEAALITFLLANDKLCQEHMKRAIHYLNLATLYSGSLEGYPAEELADFQHKLHVYSALTYLGCCITGNIVSLTVPTAKEFELAAKHLAAVEESVFIGNTLSGFRKVEYYFAKCDLIRRQSQVLEICDTRPNIKKCYELASEARDLAIAHNFSSMVYYANNRLADLTECLVHTALKAPECQKASKFFDFEY